MDVPHVSLGSFERASGKLAQPRMASIRRVRVRPKGRKSPYPEEFVNRDLAIASYTEIEKSRNGARHMDVPHVSLGPFERASGKLAQPGWRA